MRSMYWLNLRNLIRDCRMRLITLQIEKSIWSILELSLFLMRLKDFKNISYTNYRGNGTPLKRSFQKLSIIKTNSSKKNRKR